MVESAAPDDVWLIGGASGTGKSRLAYHLARSLHAPIVELDDIVEALFAMTTPEEQPVLHYWATHPEAGSWPAKRVVELHLATARALMPAVEAVIANHLATATRVIIEGDYLLPETTTRESFGQELNRGRVRAIFLVEQDTRKVVANYRRREPSEGLQLRRAEVSGVLGAWLAREAARAGVPVVSPRPWTTVAQRAMAAFAAKT